MKVIHAKKQRQRKRVGFGVGILKITTIIAKLDRERNDMSNIIGIFHMCERENLSDVYY